MDSAFICRAIESITAGGKFSVDCGARGCSVCVRQKRVMGAAHASGSVLAAFQEGFGVFNEFRRTI